MKTPSVIFNLKYFTFKDTSSVNSFYRCKNSKNILAYISRDSAHDNLSDEDKRIIDGFVELSETSGADILDYATQRPGSHGAFSLNGDLSEDDIKNFKEKMAATKATIYASVISFSTEFGPNFLTSNQEGQAILKENVRHLFKNTALDNGNFEAIAAVHTNKEHHHIHFIFFEKEPTLLNSRGHLSYSKKNALPKDNIELFKSSILNFVNGKKIDYFSLRDEIRTGVVHSLKSSQLLMDYAVSNCSDIISKNVFQYGRLSAENKRVVDKLIKEIIKSDPKTNKIYTDYKSKLRATHLDYISMIKENGGKELPLAVKNFYSSRIKELDSRLGNAFLKVLQNYSSETRKFKKEHNMSASAASSLKFNNPLKKQYNRFASMYAQQLLQGFLSDVASEGLRRYQTLEEFKKEKLLKGETVVFDINE